MSARGVWIAPDLRGRAYSAALAGLPLRAREADLPAGAVAVVGGKDGGRAAFDALAAGATGLIITASSSLSAAAARLIAAAGSVPVIVDRPLLRPDLVEQAIAGREGAAALVATAELRATGADAEGALRDAIGWSRALAGDSFGVVAAGGTPARFGALLESVVRRIPLVLTVTKATRPAGSPELHLAVLGETRSEVRLDPAAGIARVVTVDADGERIAAARREAGERLALRRCLDAVEQGVRTDDLAELAADAETTERLTASVARP